MKEDKNKYKISKIIRYSFRFRGRVTSIGVRSYILALYLTLYNVKKNRHIFIRNTIADILKDLDTRTSNKGLSEAVSVKLIEKLLEKADQTIFYRHMVRLFDEKA